MTEMICIACPIGCTLRVFQEEGEYRVTGNSCNRGVPYAIQEMTDPRRIVTSTVGVINGKRALCAVKTAGSVPKARIFDVLKAMRGSRATAPLHVGDVLIENVAQTGVSVVATASVGVNERARECTLKGFIP